MLQTGLCYAIHPVSSQSIGCFNQPADKQALKYPLNLSVRHPCCDPYLDRIGCILPRDHRQDAFLMAREHGGFVVSAHDHPKRILRVREAHMSVRMQLDQKLANGLVGDAESVDDLGSSH